MTPFSLVHFHQLFQGAGCLHHHFLKVEAVCFSVDYVVSYAESQENIKFYIQIVRE
jgi:hypothetical protein